MSDDIEEMGPIDWLLVEFSGPPTGAAAPYLLDLVERGLIRILDLVVVNKDADGTITMLELADVDGDGELDLAVFEGAQSGLLGEEDVAEAGEAMEAGTSGVFLLYENVWAAPFAVAVRKAGGQLVASGRIPVQSIIAALDDLEAADQS
ncbi:MAG TPA: DUF6325 family protein [Acidimicrobiales bacterium]